MEKGQLAEVFIEREDHPGVVGNIYKGRVTKVLSGMQAAFVDIGQDKAGFLYISEISEELIDDGEGEGADDIERRRGAPQDQPQPEDPGPAEGGPGGPCPDRQGIDRHQGRTAPPRRAASAQASRSSLESDIGCW